MRDRRRRSPSAERAKEACWEEEAWVEAREEAGVCGPESQKQNHSSCGARMSLEGPGVRGSNRHTASQAVHHESRDRVRESQHSPKSKSQVHERYDRLVCPCMTFLWICALFLRLTVHGNNRGGFSNASGPLGIDLPEHEGP